MAGHGSFTPSNGVVQPHVLAISTSTDSNGQRSLKLPAELPTSSSASTLSSADVAVDINSSSSSIYDLHNNRHRWLVLLQVAVAALLVPFTDTIYLPALPAVGKDLRASDSAVAATVAVFLFAIGVGNVFWGPFSDRFGRRLTYNICTVVYVGTTLGCVFSPNVGVLIAMRALQGFAQCSFLTTGQAVVADVFPPAFRGTALGIFMLSVLVGSVVAPMIGGALAAALGWRSTLVFLAICGGAFGLVLLIFLPETHQYMVLSRLRSKDAPRVQAITESSKILAAEPVFQPPTGVLKYLYQRDFAPYIFANGWGTACVFCVMTVWPLYAPEPPYNLDQAMVGVTYVVSGAGAVIGSLLGGRVSDRGAVVFGQKPEGRVVFDLGFAAVSMPVGLLLFGWGIAAHYHLAVILVALFLVGFGTSSLQPGVYSYVSCVDQDKAGAASAAVNGAWCTIAAVVVLVNVPGIDSLGAGGYMTLVAGIHLLLVTIAGAFSVHRLHVK